MIQPGQKLLDGDCVSGLTQEQIHDIINLSDAGWLINNLMDGFVFNGGQLYPTYLDYCLKLKEYNFTDFKQLCENTFNNE